MISLAGAELATRNFDTVTWRNYSNLNPFDSKFQLNTEPIADYSQFTYHLFTFTLPCKPVQCGANNQAQVI